MTERAKSPLDPRPTWDDIVGKVIEESNVPEYSRIPGMITLTTSDGLHICPRFQFRQDDRGEPVVITAVAEAWELLQKNQIEQLGESEWTAVARLKTERAELTGKSWADVLVDEQSSKDDIRIVFDLIIEDFVKATSRLG
jgi:hypothetical protein